MSFNKYADYEILLLHRHFVNKLFLLCQMDCSVLYHRILTNVTMRLVLQLGIMSNRTGWDGRSFHGPFAMPISQRTSVSLNYAYSNCLNAFYDDIYVT